MSDRKIRFSEFVFDPTSGELTDNGRPVKLHPQPAKVLALLLSRKGEVVTRDEIRREIWGEETFVDYDTSINSCVRQIRRALKDDADNPRYVETIAGTGYRFVEPAASSTRAQPRNVPARLAAAAAVLTIGFAAAAWLGRDRDALPRPLLLPLTAEEGFEVMPAVSPLGDRVAYIARGADGSHLEVKLLTGGAPLRLASSKDRLFRPAWSPGGDHLAYQRVLPQHGYEIVTVPALGGAERTLSTVHPKNVDANGLSYSPDGKSLAMVDAEGIVLYSLENGEKRPLTSTPPGFYDARPTFSPDGSTVAFLRRRLPGVEGRVFIQKLARGEALALTSRATRIYGLDWTRDGGSLVFSAPRVESWENVLWRVSTAAVPADPVPLPFGDSAGALSVSRRGNFLVYDRPAHKYNLWRVSGPAATRSSPPAKFLFSTRDEFAPAYSPDGSKVAFVSDREGRWALWIADADGSNPRSLTGGTHFLYPRWSSDGRELAFHSIVEPESLPAIYTIRERGGVPRIVEGTAGGGHLPSWSRDGASILFTKREGDSPRIWRVPVGGGQPTRITRERGAEPKPASSQRIFYRIGFQFASITPGGDDETPFEKLLPAHASLWDVWDEKIVYVNARARPAPRVELYDPETNETRAVAELPSGSNPRHGLSVSPDGQWVIVASDDGPGSDILVLENFR